MTTSTSNNPRISIVVCTYNRCDLLALCLEALTQQKAAPGLFEVLVVDNNSTDATAEVVKSFREKSEIDLRYCLETQVGLSFARNTGFREAKAPWIAYIDDDAKARPDFVERALWMTENTDYPFFGGLDVPWYPFGKPAWYKDRYASTRYRHKDIATLTGDEHAFGCVMVMRKDILEQFNGFNTGIGMRGKEVGYNEETELQNRLRAQGLRIGYDPHLVIDHAVAPHKLKIDWFFQAAFAHGRDKIRSGMTSSAPFNLFLIAFTGLALTFFDLLKNSVKLLVVKNYFLENWLIDTFRKAAKRVGMVYTGLFNHLGH